MCHKKTYSCIPQKSSENWCKRELFTPPLSLALIILQGENNIYPLGSFVWKYTFKQCPIHCQYFGQMRERFLLWTSYWQTHIMGCLFPISFWGTFHLFLILSSLPLVLISHIQMRWILDWPNRVTAYPYWPYSLSKPSSSPTAFPQKKKSLKKKQTEIVWPSAPAQAAFGCRSGVTCERYLKNNIRLPETGRITFIMFKPTAAGEQEMPAKHQSFLLAQEPEVGDMKGLEKNWFRGLLTLSFAHQSITSNELCRL